MSENLTLDSLAAPLRALRLLALDFGHLPVPDVQLNPIYPDRLELRFHDDMSAFEAWREALRITPDGVAYRAQSHGETHVLKATADYAGAVLNLTGYSDVRTPAPKGVAA